jgi:hypothetical protein
VCVIKGGAWCVGVEVQMAAELSVVMCWELLGFWLSGYEALRDDYPPDLVHFPPITGQGSIQLYNVCRCRLYYKQAYYLL